MAEKNSKKNATSTPSKLIFSGDFVDNATIVPTTNSTMILTTALRDDNDAAVLLPFIETKVAGIRLGEWIASEDSDQLDIDDFVPLMSVTLPLDNALFYAYDFVRDIQIACTQTANLSGGCLGLEPGLLSTAKDFAQRLNEQSKECVEAIDRLLLAAEAASGKAASV